jgi:hypothetical protein
LFSESPSRVVVSVPPDRGARLERSAAAERLSCVRLGVVVDERVLRWGTTLTLDLEAVADAQRRVFADLFDARDHTGTAPLP